VRLTNFNAVIKKVIVHDDAVEQTRLYEIAATFKGKTTNLTVPVGEYRMMRWVEKKLPGGATVRAGAGIADHARVAITDLSGDIPESITLTHTGWRRLPENRKWIYSHAGEAIGENGAVAVLRASSPTRSNTCN
jgi:hypothetical protein